MLRRHLLPLLIILLFGGYVLRSLFHVGFPYSHDAIWHIERLLDMATNLKTQFPLRWSPTLDQGYGIPLFNFTYPAPYYLGALLMWLGSGPALVYKLLLAFGYLAGGIGMYFLGGRKHVVFGVTAALLYLFTPYQFLDLYVRGALGEVIALGIVPWIVLSYAQIDRTGNSRWYSAFPLALLILSHNFSALLFGALLLYLLIFYYQHKAVIFRSLLLSLGLSSFFLLPALFERSDLLIASLSLENYREHFVGFAQLFYSPWSFAGSLAGVQAGEMSYQLGFATWLIIVGGILVRRRSAAPYFFAIFFAIFLMLPISAWFWSTIPLLSSIQFPWRLLGVITVITPLIYLTNVRRLPTRYALIISLGLISISLYNTRNYLRPVKWLNEAEFLALHYQVAGGTTTAHRSELVPRWAPNLRYMPSANERVTVRGGTIRDIVDSPMKINFSADAENSSSSVTIFRNYYPMWHAQVDGQPTPLSPTPTGEIALSLTPGDHVYTVYVGNTTIQILGNLISLASLALLLFASSPRLMLARLRSKLAHTSTHA